mmetsp:Transcript_65615/g.77124  ORF Transcript_65615/g.77124 Transcript_65615/m.77124 type:complete len:81 (+) Transcript_65615:116-358(+)
MSVSVWGQRGNSTLYCLVTFQIHTPKTTQACVTRSLHMVFDRKDVSISMGKTELLSILKRGKCKCKIFNGGTIHFITFAF